MKKELSVYVDQIAEHIHKVLMIDLKNSGDKYCKNKKTEYSNGEDL